MAGHAPQLSNQFSEFEPILKLLLERLMIPDLSGMAGQQTGGGFNPLNQLPAGVQGGQRFFQDLARAFFNQQQAGSLGFRSPISGQLGIEERPLR